VGHGNIQIKINKNEARNILGGFMIRLDIEIEIPTSRDDFCVLY
jgi:hypothetical protein